MPEQIASIINYLARASEAHHLTFSYNYISNLDAITFRFDDKYKDMHFCQSMYIPECLMVWDPLDLAELIFKIALTELS